MRFVKYNNFKSLEQHLEATSTSSPSKLSPLYLILGKDSFENKEIVQYLVGVLLPNSEMREFGLNIFDGVQLEETKLCEVLYTGSFFAKTQVVWIQQAEKLKKSTVESIEKYLNHPSPSLFLILSAGAWHKNTTFYKTVENIGVILDLAEMKPWEKEKRLVEWVNKKAAFERKIVPYPVALFLVKRTGLEWALLAQEFEKLMCYCCDKKEITREDVEAICPNQHIDSIWELGEAIFRRDSAAALLKSGAILMDGQPLLPLLRQIRSQFQTEYQISLLLEQGKQPQEITQAFPYMKGKILENHLQQARNYGVKAFKKGLLAIETAEMRIKNSSIEEKVILELLINHLTT